MSPVSKPADAEDFFNNPDGSNLALHTRSKLFPRHGNSYRAKKLLTPYFQSFTDGIRLALYIARRSGAQRGASENNFGQRFSVSTPCIFPSARQPFPPPHLEI
jgi:hypothetical protein